MGKPLKEFYEKFGYYSGEMKTDGMEPLYDLADRIINAIEQFVKSYKGDIIICSHRESMVAALIKLQNLPWPDIHNIGMPTGSIWQLNYESAEFQSAKKLF